MLVKPKLVISQAITKLLCISSVKHMLGCLLNFTAATRTVPKNKLRFRIQKFNFHLTFHFFHIRNSGQAQGNECINYFRFRETDECNNPKTRKLLKRTVYFRDPARSRLKMIQFSVTDILQEKLWL